MSNVHKCHQLVIHSGSIGPLKLGDAIQVALLRNLNIKFAQSDCLRKIGQFDVWHQLPAAKIGFNGPSKKLALIVGLLKAFQI